MRKPILPEGASLTFADYFKLNADVGDILGCFEVSYQLESCRLPHKKDLGQERLLEIKDHMVRGLPNVSMTNETARREFMIAPLLWEAALYTHAKINVEFPLEVGDNLKGTVDYLLRAQHQMLVVEAKNADLQRGFTQLAIELVALDQWASESSEPRFYGAVSDGDVWRFGFLDRAEKRITHDLNSYTVPKELEEVLQILVGILIE